MPDDSSFGLLVKSPFGNYAVGSMISDPSQVQEVLADPHLHGFVVRVAKVSEQAQAAHDENLRKLHEPFQRKADEAPFEEHH